MQHKVESLKNIIKKYEVFALLFLGLFFSCVQAMDPTSLVEEQSLHCDNHAILAGEALAQEEALGERQRVDPMLEDNFNEYALMEYITQRNVQGVQNTLKKPVNINFCCKEYYYHTPLAEAVGTGDEKIIDLILAHPAINVDLTDNENWTPLHVAAHLKLPRIACTLLQHGACLNVKTSMKHRTPLHESVYQKDQDAVCAMLTEMPQKRLDMFVRHMRQTSFLLLCCFVRWSKEECVQRNMPKDLQLMLCKYAVRANVDVLVQEQLNMLQPILESQDNAELMPFVAGISTTDLFAVPCCKWFNAVLNPQEREVRQKFITSALLRKFAQLSLVSKPHNSDKLQSQSKEDTE